MTRFDIRQASYIVYIAAAAFLCAGAIAHGSRTADAPTTVAYSVAPDAPRSESAPQADGALPGVTAASDTLAADEAIPQG